MRVDLFADEVYVFTPQGDVVALPAGASPIDFAYAVHTEVGHHCAGAKVNGQLVRLTHRLTTGDTVEIITSPHQKPRQEWLDNVVTGRARNRIRHVLRTEQVEDARSLGREILQRELQRRRMSYDQLQKAGELSKVAKELSYKDLDAMLQAVAYGRLHGRQVARKLGGDEGRGQAEPAAAGVPAEPEPGARQGRRDGSGARALRQVLLAAPGRPGRGLHHAWSGRHGARPGLPEDLPPRPGAPRAPWTGRRIATPSEA